MRRPSVVGMKCCATMVLWCRSSVGGSVVIVAWFCPGSWAATSLFIRSLFENVEGMKIPLEACTKL